MRRTISRLVGLMALCGALFALTPVNAVAAPSHPYLFSVYKFTPEPNKTEHFEDPCGLAIDPNGALYVSDYYHRKVDVFSSNGAFLTQLVGFEPLGGPCGLAVAASGNLFVNAFHQGIAAYAPAAFPIASKTAYGPPTPIDPGPSTGVAVDPASGRVYVDNGTYVGVYESSGVPVEVAGQPLRIGLGSLEDGYGVVVSAFPASAGFVYVPDAADETIKVFDPATDPVNPIATISGQGTPQGEFKTLRDAAVAIDQATGHLFVAYNSQGPFYEHPKAAVAEFNSAGEYRGTVPAPMPLWFGEPSGIAIDNSAGATQGRVYVTTGNSEFETAGLGGEKLEEGAVHVFGPGVPGQRLEVTLAGVGTGAVSSQPAGIACPGACAAEYDEAAAIKLTASPAVGSAFAGWSGGGCSGTGVCVVTMNATQSVSAEFEVAPPPATADGEDGTDHPEGGASVPAGGSSSGAAPVTLQVTPDRRASQRRKARQRARRHRHHLRHSKGRR